MTNIMVKIRKQLRLGDIYRYIVTGEIPEISKLESMYFKSGSLIVHVNPFAKYKFNCVNHSGTHDEKALRQAVKEINKILSEV